MRGIIDYAGLFPPADLSLDTSLQKYSTYRKSDDEWMLSRYIIPAARLEELKPYHDTLFVNGGPYKFSVLGKRAETISDYYEDLQNIARSIESFHNEHGTAVTSDVLELKLPREAVFANDEALLTEIYAKTAEIIGAKKAFPTEVFFEGIFDKNWEKEIGLTLEVMAEHNKKNKGEKTVRAGFKLRCGGVEASMFPSVEQVAYSLNKVRDCSLPLKCTAGLHHPVRHYDHTVKTKMHGFLNVFGGAMLGYAHDFSEGQMQAVVKEEDAEHFSFTETGFQWKDYEVSTQEIEELREVAVTSFGSCSFDEPREDLQKLGLL
jgi:hypothetical protein